MVYFCWLREDIRHLLLLAVVADFLTYFPVDFSYMCFSGVWVYYSSPHCALQRTALGQEVFDAVCRTLEVLEVEYFGLRYETAAGLSAVSYKSALWFVC